MEKSIHYFFYYLENFAILICFFLCLRLMKDKQIVEYMKGFYWYPLISGLISIPSLIISFIIPRGNEIFNNISVLINLSLIFHFVFLSEFILKVTPGKKPMTRILLRLIFWMFFAFVIFFLFSGDITKSAHTPYVISSLGLSFFCVVYYYHLFNNVPNLKLKDDPAFWIITGIFFAMSLHIPIGASIEYLKKKVIRSDYLMLYNFLIFSYTIMYIFFIKGILCAVNHQKMSSNSEKFIL